MSKIFALNAETSTTQLVGLGKVRGLGNRSNEKIFKTHN